MLLSFKHSKVPLSDSDSRYLKSLNKFLRNQSCLVLHALIFFVKLIVRGLSVFFSSLVQFHEGRENKLSTYKAEPVRIIWSTSVFNLRVFVWFR